MTNETYTESPILTPDVIVAKAAQWRAANLPAPIQTGRRALEYRAMAAERMPYLYRKASQQAIFFEDLVRDTIAQIFEAKYPPTRWASGELISLDRGGSPGAESFSWMSMDRSGHEPISALNSEDGKDIKSVEIIGNRQIQNIHDFSRSFRWTVHELEKAEFQGLFSLVERKAMATRRQLDRDLESFIAVGVPGLGWPSVYRIPGQQTLTLPDGSDPWNDPAKTTVDMYNDFVHFIHQATVIATEGVEQPDTVIFGRRVWELVLRMVTGTEQASAADNRVLIERLRDTFPQITLWTWDRHLDGDSIFIYNRQPLNLSAWLPLSMQMRPPQEDALAFKVIIRNRFGGVWTEYPRSTAIVDGLMPEA